MRRGGGWNIVPSVNSLEEAEKAEQAVKYPPEGKREVGLAHAQSYGFEEYKDIGTNNIKLILQIEHINAIDELDEIIALNGVD